LCASLLWQAKDVMGKVMNEVKSNDEEGRQQIRIKTEHRYL
jgi:hypothetical protein